MVKKKWSKQQLYGRLNGGGLQAKLERRADRDYKKKILEFEKLIKEGLKLLKVPVKARVRKTKRGIKGRR